MFDSFYRRFKVSKVVTPKLSTVHYYYKTSGIEAAKIISKGLGITLSEEQYKKFKVELKRKIYKIT